MIIIDEVDEGNYVPVDKDKLKEEHQKELCEAIDIYERECLKSFSTTRSRDVVKKFDFPKLQPLSEAQRENKMTDTIYQAVGQAFIKSATVMVIQCTTQWSKPLQRARSQAVWVHVIYSRIR